MAGDISEGWNGVPVAALLPQNSAIPGFSQDVAPCGVRLPPRLHKIRIISYRICLFMRAVI